MLIILYHAIAVMCGATVDVGMPANSGMVLGTCQHFKATIEKKLTLYRIMISDAIIVTLSADLLKSKCNEFRPVAAWDMVPDQTWLIRVWHMLSALAQLDQGPNNTVSSQPALTKHILVFIR